MMGKHDRVASQKRHPRPVVSLLTQLVQLVAITQLQSPGRYAFEVGQAEELTEMHCPAPTHHLQFGLLAHEVHEP